ncbi:hypothetical protein PCAR4_290060 [Paraburkholderia caribensis]|nr:hypothetical protein PCAR4_290060 [Paraburkholderia caribensis]
MPEVNMEGSERMEALIGRLERQVDSFRAPRQLVDPREVHAVLRALNRSPESPAELSR